MNPPSASMSPDAGPTLVHKIVVGLLAVVFLITPYLWTSPAQKGAAVGNELVGDGLQLVTQHPTLREVQSAQGFGNQLSALGSTFGKGWWEGIHDEQMLYRPVSLFALGLGGMAAGPYSEQRPGDAGLSYHVLVLFLNLVCALLVMELAWSLFANRNMALVAGALFATLPVHGEVLYDVAGLAELCCTAFSLAAWVLWIRVGDRPTANTGALAGCFACLGLATLSKESAFVLPLVFFLTDVGRAKEGGIGEGVKHAMGKLVGLAGCVGVLGASLALRFGVLGGMFPRHDAQHVLDNPLLEASALDRMLNGLRVTAAGVPIMLGFNPLRGDGSFGSKFGFSPDYSFEQVPVLGAFSLWNLVGLLFVLGSLAAAVGLYRKCRMRASLVLVLFASMLLTSNVLVPIGTVFGERLLFFPSVALVLFAAAFLGRMGKPGVIVGLGVAVLCGGVVWSNSRTWKSQDDLWEYAAEEAAPNSAKAHYNDGFALLRDDVVTLATQAFERSIAIHPNYVDAHNRLGQLHLSAYERDKAIPHFQRALEIQLEETGWEYRGEGGISDRSPSLLLYTLTKIRVFDSAIDQPVEHLAWLDGLIEKGYDSPDVHQRRAETLRKLGRGEDAEAAWKRSIEIRPLASALRSYGMFLRQTGRDGDARDLYSSASLEGMNAGSQIEILLARGDAELLEDPGKALRTAEEVLEFGGELGGEQRFRAKLLQAQSTIDLQGANYDPEQLEQARRYLMSGLRAWSGGSEETYIAKRALAQISYWLHMNQEAIGQLEEIVRYTDDLTMRQMLGETLLREGEAEQAIEHFLRVDEAAENDPSNPAFSFQLVHDARARLLRAYRELGREDEAQVAIDGWHERAPGEHDAIALYLHSLWLAQGGDIEGAKSRAQLLVEAFPEEPAGPALVQQVQVLEALEGSVASGSATDKEYRDLAILRRTLGNLNGSEELLREGIERTEDPLYRAEFHQLLSRTLEASGNIGGALEEIKLALEGEPPAEVRDSWERWREAMEFLASRAAG